MRSDADVERIRGDAAIGTPTCQQRDNKRAGEQVHCDPSRFIKEMKLDEGDAVPTAAEIISPKERLANLKALLSRADT